MRENREWSLRVALKIWLMNSITFSLTDIGEDHNTDYEDLMDVAEGKKFRTRKQELRTPSSVDGSKTHVTPFKKKKRNSKALFEIQQPPCSV